MIVGVTSPVETSGDLLIPEPATPTGIKIGYAR
jgi:hypothetical protein